MAAVIPYAQSSVLEAGEISSAGKLSELALVN